MTKTNNVDRIASYLNLVSTNKYPLTIEELCDLVHPDIDCEELLETIKSDIRFIILRNDLGGQSHIIPITSLVLWLINLSVRLAVACPSRISEYQLARLVNSFCINGKWNIVPPELVRFAQQFGFIGPAYTSGQYVFPIAHILSTMSEEDRNYAREGLEELRGIYPLVTSIDELFQKSVRDGFSGFESRVSDIVQARVGLIKQNKMTLEQIGNNLNLTRERVRQLENKFWKRLAIFAKRRPFIMALLLDIMRNHGRLVITADSTDVTIRRFIAHCAGIPQTRMPHTKLFIIGASRTDIPAPKATGWFPEELDEHSVANILETDAHFSLIAEDVKLLAESLVQFRQNQLTSGQRIYLTLKAIGKPSHSAEITEVHNSLFPQHPSTEHNIHAVLSRGEYGIVWIGIRSTFALKDWGYERPSKTLFNTVKEIVINKFKETANPVPLEVIVAEIGKYRKVVRHSSLAIAAYCNPALQCVSRTSFVPKSPIEEIKDEISVNELDRILKEFESPASFNQNTSKKH